MARSAGGELLGGWNERADGDASDYDAEGSVSVDILIGDVFDQLARLPSQSVDCCVTSPPYWGLRDYDVEGQIGLEPTLGEHLDVMVRVFRDVRRVLKAQGTCWLNYGDCYAAAPNGKSAAAYKADASDDRTFRDKPFSTVGPIYNPASVIGGYRGGDKNLRNPAGRIEAGGYLKPKDLCMIPNRLAIALQDDGWYVRSEIIWHKPNPMPESVYDRPTSAHEKIWLLSKTDDYFYNHEAIREPVTGGTHARKPGPNSRQNVDRVPVSRKAQGPITRMDANRVQANLRVKVPGGCDVEPGTHGKIHKGGRTEATYTERSSKTAAGDIVSDTRNARNVWTIAPKPFREAHFATFPPALAERCIKAGTPPTVCGYCGAVEGCGGICQSFPRVPGRVLDPFGGAGTVGLVAESLGLDATLIELNPDYAEMARNRIDAARDKAEAA
jgi:DNA modification methylase